MPDRLSPGGATTFGIIWFGQLVSSLGSSMTAFGLAIWVYAETGSAAQLALLVIAARAPIIVVSPLAGALVDRWDRRIAMIVSDAGAASATLATFVLLATGAFEIWHLYVTLPVVGVFSALQFPAYSAAVTTLVPRRHYARASGLVQLAGSASRVAAPALAAAMVATGGLAPLFLFDLTSFVAAVLTLAVVRFPKVRAGSDDQDASIRRLAGEARAGLDFVLEHRALLLLLLSFLLVSFAFAFYSVLAIPLLLELTDARSAGLAVSIGAGALVLGSLVLSAWGGPANRVAGVYVPIAAMGVGLVVMGGARSLGWVIAGSVLMHSTHPVAGGSSQSIWQSKVPADLQGRVFAFRQMATSLPAPVAYLLAGVLADRVFEPLMAQPGTILTSLLGSGPGRGIGLLLALIGVISVVTATAALRHPRLRNLDEEIPDLDHAAAA